MTGTVFLIIAVIVLLLVLPTVLRSPSSSPYRAPSIERANQLLTRGETELMMGNLEAAESAFSQAMTACNGHPLLMSEAHYGLFRTCEKRGDLQGAIRSIDAALSYAPQWCDIKPNYATLLEREKRRILDEISRHL